MSRELSKEALVRMAWVTELRRQGHRKCIGVGVDNQVCALGILSEVINVPWVGIERYDYLERASGLSKNQIDVVWKMNDGVMYVHDEYNNIVYSFAQIADKIESWFPK
jgi:hypothetical protein